jgi:environmental stress-induced protein Ves
MRIEVLGPDDFRSMTWRNGLGMTVEMAREDDANGVMLWRVSAADVVEPGEFSIFPGVDRILTLIEGPGFDLDFAEHGGVTPVEPLHPVSFSGDWTTRAQTVRGQSRVLNVMTARGQATAIVSVHKDTRAIARFADRSLIVCLDGRTSLTVGDAALQLAPAQVALVSDGTETAGTLTAAGAAIQIDITLATGTPTPRR